MKHTLREVSSFNAKLFIGEHTEGIIRKLCAALPENEWSGILFYNEQGSLEDGTFEIHCKDILLMDIGTRVHTQFSYNNPEISRYMVEHPELMDCRMGQIHSHDTFKSFHSGEDMQTLAEDADDTTNALSVVVNNAGEYVALITRKLEIHRNVATTQTIHEEASYKVFENTVRLDPQTRVEKSVEDKVDVMIDAIHLDVERPVLNQEAFEYDERLGSILKNSQIRLPAYAENALKDLKDWKKDNGMGKGASKTPSLFESLYKKDYEEEIPFKEVANSAVWERIDKTAFLNQFLWMCPFMDKKTTLKEMLSHYKRRFPNVNRFSDWVSHWADWIFDAWNFSKIIIKPKYSDLYDIDERAVAAYIVKTEVVTEAMQARLNSKYIDTIVETLETLYADYERTD